MKKMLTFALLMFSIMEQWCPFVDCFMYCRECWTPQVGYKLGFGRCVVAGLPHTALCSLGGQPTHIPPTSQLSSHNPEGQQVVPVNHYTILSASSSFAFSSLRWIISLNYYIKQTGNCCRRNNTDFIIWMDLVTILIPLVEKISSST